MVAIKLNFNLNYLLYERIWFILYITVTHIKIEEREKIEFRKNIATFGKNYLKINIVLIEKYNFF